MYHYIKQGFIFDTDITLLWTLQNVIMYVCWEALVSCELTKTSHFVWSYRPRSDSPPYFISLLQTGLPRTWIWFYSDDRLTEFWISSHPCDLSRCYCADMLPVFKRYDEFWGQEWAPFMHPVIFVQSHNMLIASGFWFRMCLCAWK